MDGHGNTIVILNEVAAPVVLKNLETLSNIKQRQVVGKAWIGGAVAGQRIDENIGSPECWHLV